MKLISRLACLHFLLHSTILSFAGAKLDIPDAVLKRFKERNLLRDDFDVEQNMQDMTGGSFSMDGETIAYEKYNLDPMNVFTESATYYLDGEQQPDLPAIAVFRCKSHPDWKISMTESGKVQQASMNKEYTGTTGESMDLVPLEAGSDLFVAIRPDDIDPAKLRKFKFGDIEETDRLLKHSRGDGDDEDATTLHNSNRALQACSSFTVIEVAIAYDSTFCRDFGGTDDTANTAVQSIIQQTSEHYQQAGVCRTVAISHLEGFCDSQIDVYASMVEADIACGTNSSPLGQFDDYWTTNRESILRDTAHLFYGGHPRNGGTIGCASVGSLCDLSRAYGANEIGFSANPTLRSILFSHELGHNAGSNHDETDGINVMSSFICDCPTFSSASISQVNDYIDGQSCITAGQPPTPAPTGPLIPAPTAAPIPAPTAAPIPAPTAAPIPTPTGAPVPAPTYSSPTPPGFILWADFSTSSDGFEYQDDLFRGTSESAYADGVYVPDGGFEGDGALEVTLGGIDNNNIVGMSGGWQRTFELSEASTIIVKLTYGFAQSSAYEYDEVSEALCSIDGNLLGSNGNPSIDFVAQLVGDAEGGPTKRDFGVCTLFPGQLSQGTHTIAVGAYNNKKTSIREVTVIHIDSIEIIVDPDSY